MANFEGDIMQLRDKYFHSIHSYIETQDRDIMLEDIINKIEKILVCGYILPYKDIERIYGKTISKNKYANLNGNDFISISLHESNPQKIDEECIKDVSDYENAFQSFILQEPSIVLKPQIVEDLKIITHCGIYLERLVAEPISLEYMCAISVFGLGVLAPFFKKIPKSEYYRCTNDTSFRKIDIEYLDRIKDLLVKYNYNVPIIDITSGNPYKENEGYRQYIKSLKK